MCSSYLAVIICLMRNVFKLINYYECFQAGFIVMELSKFFSLLSTSVARSSVVNKNKLLNFLYTFLIHEHQFILNEFYS